MDKLITIRITKQTIQELKQILRKSETFDEGISRLLKEWENKN